MYAVIYDFGTSSVKTCLFDIGSGIRLAASSSAAYALYVDEHGGAEQDPDEWWNAICSSTRDLFHQCDVQPEAVSGIAFCTQIQGSVFVDENGNALRRPMNYLDQRGVKEYKACMGSGLLKVSGCNLIKLLRNLAVNYAASTSAKDPVWKYKWVENHEPEVFRKAYKWLDINDYLTARCTGKIYRTADSAFATFLYDTRKGREGWNKGLVRMYGIDPKHLPEIIDCTAKAGELTGKAASDLGLPAGIPVFAGGGDTTFVSIGAGAAQVGDTHIYVGTSGWVSTFLDRQTVDIHAMITGVLSACPGYYNYYAELETAGKCIEWAKEHLILEEFRDPRLPADVKKNFEAFFMDFYVRVSDVISKVPPGANGVIFTPWLQGNRCPFEDAGAGGMFFNLRIGTGKKEMLRAVFEGICYHLRWLLECEAKKVKTSDVIRFVGGVSLSPVFCQMLADITGRKIETIRNAQDAGAMGAALTVACGIRGGDVREMSRKLITPLHTYIPDRANRAVYERNYLVFRQLYRSNAAGFRNINSRPL